MVARSLGYLFILITVISSLTMCNSGQLPESVTKQQARNAQGTAPAEQAPGKPGEKPKPGQKPGQKTATKPGPMKPGNAKFEVGQVWTYKVRPQDKDSTLIVTKIDERKGHKIIHISIMDVRIKDPSHPQGYTMTIFDAPMQEKALANSVVTLVRPKARIPDHALDNYPAWHKQWEAGKAGDFNQPVSEFVRYIEEAMNHH